LFCFLGGISDRDLGLSNLVSTEERERQRELKQKQERRVTNILMGKMREDIEFLGKKSLEKIEKEVNQGLKTRRSALQGNRDASLIEKRVSCLTGVIEHRKGWSSPVQGFCHNPLRCVDAVHH
jgi:hypothetical protein